MISRVGHKITINNKYRREAFFAIVFILPYIETFIGGTWKIGKDAVGRAIIGLEIVIALILLIRESIRKKDAKVKISIEFIFVFYVVIELLFSTKLASYNVSTALWMTIPLVCAAVLSNRIKTAHYDFNKVLYYGMVYFTCYTIALLLYNIVVLGAKFSETRLVAPAGGPVIFGYTIAVCFALIVTNKQIFSPRTSLVLKLFYTIVAVLTGSRGGVWPIVFLWIFDYLKTKFSFRKLVASIIFISLLIFINPFEYAYQLMPRLFGIQSVGRVGTTLGVLSAFSSFELSGMLLGTGPGDYYPYQRWVNKNIGHHGFGFVNQNTFYRDGLMLLVQPHNAYLYYLMELGLIGLIIVLLICIKNLNYNNKDNRINRLVLIGTILLVNMVDSVFIVEPGVALVMWLLILTASIERASPFKQ